MNRSNLPPLISGWLAFWVVLWNKQPGGRIDALPAASIIGTLVGVLVIAVVALVSRATATSRMNLERGFRRIVLVVSCAIALTSGIAVGLEVRRVADFQEYQRIHARREERFQAWLAPRPISQEQVRERLRRFRTKNPWLDRDIDQKADEFLAEGEILHELRWQHARPIGLDKYVDFRTAEQPWWDWSLGRVALLGAASVIGLTTLPWGVFYLFRWIVRGFLA